MCYFLFSLYYTLLISQFVFHKLGNSSSRIVDGTNRQGSILQKSFPILTRNSLSDTQFSIVARTSIFPKILLISVVESIRQCEIYLLSPFHPTYLRTRIHLPTRYYQSSFCNFEHWQERCVVVIISSLLHYSIFNRMHLLLPPIRKIWYLPPSILPISVLESVCQCDTNLPSAIWNIGKTRRRHFAIAPFDDFQLNACLVSTGTL